MRSAVACRNIRAFYERDLRFHLLICEKTGNRYLEQDLRRLIVPLFAFVVLRVHGEDKNPETWARSIEQHEFRHRSLLGDNLRAHARCRQAVSN